MAGWRARSELSGLNWPWRVKPSSISPFSDATKTFLLALYQSADAFPPLKSACGAALAIWETAERTKRSKKAAKALALRCYEILDSLADAVADPSDLSITMQSALTKFINLLNEIKTTLESMQKRRWIWNQDPLHDFERRLDDARTDLLTAATLRTLCVSESTSKQLAIGIQQTDATLHCITQKVVAELKYIGDALVVLSIHWVPGTCRAVFPSTLAKLITIGQLASDSSNVV